MKLQKLISDDEIMTDSFKYTEDWDGLVFRIVGKVSNLIGLK